MWNRKFIIGFISILLLVACGKQPMYEKSYSFPGNSWTQKVKPFFKVTIDDTTKAYNFTINFRVTTDYAYNNEGTWIGKKTGTVVETSLNFNRRKLPKKGVYYFTLEQGVTLKSLDEVLDIGLKVEEAN
jgi:hypothetical protein